MVPLPLLWLGAFVAAAVFAVMLHSIATFRRDSSDAGSDAGAGDQDATPQPLRMRNPPALAEILWALVPIFIMISSALPAVRMLASQHITSTVQAHNDP